MVCAVELVKAPTAGPDDVAALVDLDARGLRVPDVLAVVGKTEGNGCVNDFSRTLAARAWRDGVAEHVVTVMSGGTEGVLSPHVTLVARSNDDGGTGIVGAVARTRELESCEIGRIDQVEQVAAAVREAMDQAGLAVADVHLALVKCPLLTSTDVAACRERGDEPVTHDTYESMAFSRRASALGVALALGEHDLTTVRAALTSDGDVWSSVASVSAGAEIRDCHVLVLGSAPKQGRLSMAHTVMRDAIDASAVEALLAPVRAGTHRLVQLFAKAEASPLGTIRGRRHTMLTDSDLAPTRHARAAVGGLLAGLSGDPCIYVSGGAEAQGPPGGGPVTVVFEAV